jgi:transposase
MPVCGCKVYDPEILLVFLFYGYATGTFSSIKLEFATYEYLAFRYIAGNTHTDHYIIANIRNRFLVELNPLFVKILCLAHEMNYIKIGKISSDRTKIKANASTHHALQVHEIQLPEMVTMVKPNQQPCADSCVVLR